MSAIWIGAAPVPGCIVLKPYFNLNRNTPRERWLRIGRMLAELQRPRSLEFLCSISPKVSEGSLPVGLTVDLLPDGTSGRVKAYFRSAVPLLNGWTLVQRNQQSFPFPAC
jgi:hypothetical protein